MRDFADDVYRRIGYFTCSTRRPLAICLSQLMLYSAHFISATPLAITTRHATTRYDMPDAHIAAITSASHASSRQSSKALSMLMINTRWFDYRHSWR